LSIASQSVIIGANCLFYGKPKVKSERQEQHWPYDVLRCRTNDTQPTTAIYKPMIFWQW